MVVRNVRAIPVTDPRVSLAERGPRDVARPRGRSVVNDRVYIHEFIDIIGHGRAHYMQHMTANWGPIGQEERNQLCYGVWAPVGSTGAWPKTINRWEHDGWSAVAASLGRETVVKGAQDPALERWWAKAADFRSGGVDRIVVPAPWT